ncbi:MAG: 50S ribosomal protein L3 [Candidatus Diapherotrites archaeon]|uniref:50S ribosomal protein L3 n=1 Tax=Candidatus Iainarchaeum sp. TaxID=3101447 RepID=A0A938YVK0_9ARCH|nr:50S ribosomal protein L3 [Candidatus Diapherotrites archaeon]
MVKKYRPRAGSLAVYPRKRAKRERPGFRAMPAIAVKEGEQSKPLNFLGYKVGMTHVLGRDSHEKGVTFGQEIAVPATVVECPALAVFGIRAYKKAEKGYGTAALADVFAKNIDKSLLKKIRSFKRKQKKEKKGGKEKKRAEEKPEKTAADLEKEKEKIIEVKLLCHSKPGMTTAGKKKPDVVEIALSGNAEQQLAYAKEALGKDLGIGSVFAEHDFIDVKAVTKGKGMQGPVKRFGVKTQRPKAKKQRVVGSIGPWNPSTVMFTVARPGQMGYHTRTELNKRVLKIGSAAEAAKINPKSGFKDYGILKNDFILVRGSIPGHVKRAIGIRHNIRKTPLLRHKLESIDFIATSREKPSAILEEEVKAVHVVTEKEEKAEKKSVADEIAVAAKGEQKKEKPKEN